MDDLYDLALVGGGLGGVRPLEPVLSVVPRGPVPHVSPHEDVHSGQVAVLYCELELLVLRLGGLAREDVATLHPRPPPGALPGWVCFRQRIRGFRLLGRAILP